MLVRVLACLVLFAVAPTAAGSEEGTFPSAPIKLVLPLAAGGATDTLARISSEAAEPFLGQPIIIENRPGAGGALAANSVLKSPPDGQVLLFANFATHTVAPRLLKSVTYDPLKDFAPVSLIATQPHVLLINPDLGIATVADLIAHVRNNPGKFNYASSGVGSPLHLAGEYLKRAADLDIVHVPYKASGPALMDVIAGRVEIMFDNISTGLPYARSGKLKALAITSGQRSPLAPELSTMSEAGLAGFETYGYWGVSAPSGTPSERIEKIGAAYRRGVSERGIARKLEEQGFTVVGSSAEDFNAFVKRDVERWSDIIQAAAPPKSQ